MIELRYTEEGLILATIKWPLTSGEFWTTYSFLAKYCTHIRVISHNTLFSITHNMLLYNLSSVWYSGEGHWVSVDQSSHFPDDQVQVLEPVGEVEGKVRGGVVRHENSGAPVTVRLSGVDPASYDLLSYRVVDSIILTL